jgi:hypothetical protein
MGLEILPADFRSFKQAGKELNIPVEWGGDWKQQRWPRFQLCMRRTCMILNWLRRHWRGLLVAR